MKMIIKSIAHSANISIWAITGDTSFTRPSIIDKLHRVGVGRVRHQNHASQLTFCSNCKTKSSYSIFSM